MKFGKVLEHREPINLELPKDHENTKKVLIKNNSGFGNIFVGCAKWNRQDLKGFYPRGTKDELAYYATQFNSIELNATFYRIFPNEQSTKWAQKTPDDFKFFPKVPQIISHIKRLSDCSELIKAYCDSIAGFGNKLGTPFLQMPENFSPKNFDRLQQFVQQWPSGIPLALELRHTDWYNDSRVSEKLYTLLESYQIICIITDTAGRRDLLHMRLTTPSAFIRYVGANSPADYSRLDTWAEKIKSWRESGLKNLYFFVHQNTEIESPLLSAHFIRLLNKTLGISLRNTTTLF